MKLNWHVFLLKAIQSKFSGKGDTLLHLAVRTQDVGILEMFLNKKNKNYEKYLKRKNKDGDTPLHLAVKNEDGYNVVKELLKYIKKEDLNIKNKNKETALQLAVCKRRFDIARLLIDKGANFEIRDKYSKTIIHDIVRVMDVELLNILIKKGVDLNSLDSNGRTPLDRAKGYLEGAKGCLKYAKINACEDEVKIEEQKVKNRQKIMNMLYMQNKEELPMELCKNRLIKNNKSCGFLGM